MAKEGHVRLIYFNKGAKTEQSAEDKKKGVKKAVVDIKRKEAPENLIKLGKLKQTDLTDVLTRKKKLVEKRITKPKTLLSEAEIRIKKMREQAEPEQIRKLREAEELRGLILPSQYHEYERTTKKKLLEEQARGAAKTRDERNKEIQAEARRREQVRREEEQLDLSRETARQTTETRGEIERQRAVLERARQEAEARGEELRNITERGRNEAEQARQEALAESHRTTDVLQDTLATINQARLETRERAEAQARAIADAGYKAQAGAPAAAAEAYTGIENITPNTILPDYVLAEAGNNKKQLNRIAKKLGIQQSNDKAQLLADIESQQDTVKAGQPAGQPIGSGLKFKRGRGRPKKHMAEAPKRGRGRPRKHQVEGSGLVDDALEKVLGKERVHKIKTAVGEKLVKVGKKAFDIAKSVGLIKAQPSKKINSMFDTI